MPIHVIVNSTEDNESLVTFETDLPVSYSVGDRWQFAAFSGASMTDRDLANSDALYVIKEVRHMAMLQKTAGSMVKQQMATIWLTVEPIVKGGRYDMFRRVPRENGIEDKVGPDKKL
jgi:hypothetical protein